MASPALIKRAKTSQAVVEFLYREMFEGRLRPGDRIDVESTAAALGVSAAPVREALVLLERDGAITTRVHRAAYVEHFDARTLRADFHVLGLLSGVAVARLAKDRDPVVIAEMRRLLADLRECPPDARTRWQDVATEIVRVQHQAGATPRLRAELRGFSGFLEWAARMTDDRPHAEIVQAHTRVIDQIEAGNERGASRCRLADARAAAEELIRDLVERGVLSDDGL